MLGWVCQRAHPKWQQGLVVVYEIRTAVLGEDHRRVVAPASWPTVQPESTASGPRSISSTFTSLVYSCHRFNDFCQKYQDEFISVLLVASVSFKPTIEHEYASILFTLDKLRHPLFQNVPFEPVGPRARFEISEVEYREKRVRLYEGKLIMIVKYSGSVSRN